MNNTLVKITNDEHEHLNGCDWMPLSDALPIYESILKQYRRGLFPVRPIMVDMDGNEIY